jgi:hypothetical protein
MTDSTPHDPTSSSKPLTQGRGDTPPPRPPRESVRSSPGERQFEHDGQNWVAFLSGKSACGTGSYGLGLLEAVHFADADAPTVPLREALLARGRFDSLYDVELIGLLEVATPITGTDRS